MARNFEYWMLNIERWIKNEAYVYTPIKYKI